MSAHHNTLMLCVGLNGIQLWGSRLKPKPSSHSLEQNMICDSVRFSLRGTVVHLWTWDKAKLSVSPPVQLLLNQARSSRLQLCADEVEIVIAASLLTHRKQINVFSKSDKPFLSQEIALKNQTSLGTLLSSRFNSCLIRSFMCKSIIRGLFATLTSVLTSRNWPFANAMEGKRKP